MSKTFHVSIKINVKFKILGLLFSPPADIILYNSHKMKTPSSISVTIF